MTKKTKTFLSLPVKENLINIPILEKTLCCKKCKSTDLLFQAWVDEFNKFVIHSDPVWCRVCDQLTQEELKKEKKA